MTNFTYKGIGYSIEPDPEPLNPRTDWDNMGTMVCFHRRYNLGDEKHGFSTPEQLTDFLNSNEDHLVYLPLYLHDHSGITISTTPFTDQWDSGMVGYIYYDMNNLSSEAWSQDWKDKYYKDKSDREIVETLLKGEVETYDQFLTGDVYYYTIDEAGDSCGGFYGGNMEENGLMDYVRNSIDCYLTEKTKKEHFKRIERKKVLIGTRAFKKRKYALRTL